MKPESYQQLRRQCAEHVEWHAKNYSKIVQRWKRRVAIGKKMGFRPTWHAALLPPADFARQWQFLPLVMANGFVTHLNYRTCEEMRR